jgi:hypothetical protein
MKTTLMHWRLAALLAITLMLPACSDSSGDLVGVWTQAQGGSPNSILTLNEGGDGELQIKGGVGYQIQSWKVESGNHLGLTLSGDTVRGLFAIEDEKLTLSGMDEFEELNGVYRKR